MTLYLGGTVTRSGVSDRIEPPFVDISIWQSSSSLSGRTFVLQHFHGGGFASYCSTAKACDQLDGARVSFDRVTEDHLTGTVDLTLRGRQITKSFNARRLDIRMMCG